MKIRTAILAAAAAVLAGGAHAGVILEDMPSPGARYDRSVVLAQDALAQNGKLLPKGSYDLRIESLGNGKLRASFHQGGVKKGEANGIVVVGGRTANPNAKAGPGAGPHVAPSFSDLGFGPATPHALRAQGTGLELVVGQQGSNQILIGLLLPAVNQGLIGPNSQPGAQKVQPAK